MSSAVVAGSALLRQARRFFFVGDTQISDAAASDCLGNVAPERQRPRFWCLQRAHCGQWPAIPGPETAAFPRSLPIIGVRRAIVQCRAHDLPHRTAPRQSRSWYPRAAGVLRPEEGVFSRGGISVDSWTPGPKPLCHRHPTGPHPSGLLWTPATGASTKDNIAPGLHIGAPAAHNSGR